MDKDILDAIATFRVAFLRKNMKPPAIIILGGHDEGMRLLSYLRDTNCWIGDPRLGNPIQTVDGVYMEMELMGMKVRWPANKIATRSGDFYA